MMNATGIKQHLLIGLLVLFSVMDAQANKGIVIGMVIDAQKHPNEYATPALLHTGTSGSEKGTICNVQDTGRIENTPESLQVPARNINMTSLAFGGTGVLFTRINNQAGIMTGGRGSATFNNRYTFGGGGWGMPNGIETGSNTDTLELFKTGYGGLEFGAIFFEGEKVRLGSNLLAGFGVGFQESYPKSKGEVKMFPVLEPSVYAQIALGPLLKLDIGCTYRFVPGSGFSFISSRQLSGPSIYLAFLVGTCNCNK